MELNKAIEKLKILKKKQDRCSPNIEVRNNACEFIEAIDTVLDELNNRNKRIHKLEKNIEFIINKIVNKAKEYQYHTEITAGTNIETNIRQQTLTELLEEIEKEI